MKVFKGISNFLCEINIHRYKVISTKTSLTGWVRTRLECKNCGKITEKLK